jgi:outer membrane protein assembly factor BamB
MFDRDQGLFTSHLQHKLSRRTVMVGGTLVGFGIAVSRSVTASADDVISQSQPTATPLGDPIPPEVAKNPNDWPLWNGNYAATRAASNSTITSDNLSSLAIAWTVPVEGVSGFGGITSPVLVAGNRIYFQDNSTNTYAIMRDTGEQIWETKYDVSQAGPNGIAIGYGMVFGAIGPTAEAFALDAETGKELWKRKLTQNPRETITGAPMVYNSVVYFSTTPSYAGGDRGVLYAMDASTGDVLWWWDTTSDNLWGAAARNSGGGIWYPLAVDADGNVYFGTGNPAPFPDNNGATRPGDNLYTSSMVSLDPTDGSVRWFYQDKPHDVADHDFQNTPVVATVELDGTPVTVAIGSGKSGNLAAVLADSGNLLWKAPVGTHNEYGDGMELPSTPVTVLPGAAGGVQVPIAYANNTVFVPVNEQSAEMNEASFSGLTPYDQATGLLIALDATNGTQKWSVDLPSLPTGAATVANDVVFVGMLSGEFRAYSVDSGEQVWSMEFDAGFNAPPSIAGDTIYLALGGPKIAPRAAGATPVPGADNPAAPAAGAELKSAIYALKISGS